jgi:magnesium chelatase family protein
VEVTRGQRAISFPAAAMLVGACNRCPCARPREECRCGDVDRERYARRLSAPLLDRIDLVCELEAATPLELVRDRGGGESTATVRARVVAARERQRRRLAGTGAFTNGEMTPPQTHRDVRVAGRARTRLIEGHAGHGLTGRGHDRVLRLARTVADLAGREAIEPDDVDEALGFRLGAQAAAA